MQLLNFTNYLTDKLFLLDTVTLNIGSNPQSFPNMFSEFIRKNLDHYLSETDLLWVN